jgi:hypothetical protein
MSRNVAAALRNARTTRHRTIQNKKTTIIDSEITMLQRYFVASFFVQTCLWPSIPYKVEGWLPISVYVNNRSKSTPKQVRFAARKRQPIVDAEFERVQLEQKVEQGTTDYQSTNDILTQSKSLIDLSLEADPDFNNTRVPFLDAVGERYIDVKLAFMADCDGVNYGIGIPFDHTAAITVEIGDGSVKYVSPDDDENEEVMQIFAAQLQTKVGENLQLKRTPRVLTIAGPLEDSTNNWMESILPKPVGIDELMDETDEDLEFFHKFMKEELGEEAYESAMNDATDDLPEDIARLFNIPGLGDQTDDAQGIKELIESMREEPEAQTTAKLSEIGTDLNHDGVALKLVSYMFPGGKEYSLVYLLKPYVLIARCVQTDDDIRFDLLTREEEKLVAPRIEELCKDDLEMLSVNKKVL